MIFSLPLLSVLAICAVARSTPRQSQGFPFSIDTTITEVLSGSTLSGCANRTIIEEKTLGSGVVVTQFLCNDPVETQSNGALEKRETYYCPPGMQDQSHVPRDSRLTSITLEDSCTQFCYLPVGSIFVVIQNKLIPQHQGPSPNQADCGVVADAIRDGGS
jgi:hypothetical protein